MSRFVFVCRDKERAHVPHKKTTFYEAHGPTQYIKLIFKSHQNIYFIFTPLAGWVKYSFFWVACSYRHLENFKNTIFRIRRIGFSHTAIAVRASNLYFHYLSPPSILNLVSTIIKEPLKLPERVGLSQDRKHQELIMSI